MWAEGVLGVFESEVMREVLREVLGAKREEVRGGWKNIISRSFMICAFGQSFGTWVCGRTEMYTGFWWEVSRKEAVWKIWT